LMPPPKQCQEPGCPGDAERKYCPPHIEKHRAQNITDFGASRNRNHKRNTTPERQRQIDKRRGSASSRGYGSEWRRTRKDYLEMHPWCMCGNTATEVHHKRDKRAGGSDHYSNLQAMCKPCHSRLTLMNTNSRGGG